jgi:1-acyl-sn-glycerol-3-phosphate acyltransferase
LVTATILVLLAALLPFHVRGYRPSFLVLGYFVRILLRVLRVEVVCPEAERLAAFSGFVFANHVSYLDILVLLAVTPVSFLAKDEVRRMPLIGWIARAIGCVFVERADKASRQAARHTLSRISYHPPIVLYPEGQRGPGTELLPFRYGAFEIVTDVGAAFLPCAVTYSNLEAAIWQREEGIGRALQRLARFKGPLVAEISLLEPVLPTPGASPVELSEMTHQSLTAVWQEHQLTR